MRVAALAAALGLATAQAPAYRAEVAPVRWQELRYSYRAGCPVPPSELRAVRLSYWGFDGRAHEGALVVNRRGTGEGVAMLRRLCEARSPIGGMQPVAAYRGSDDAAMAADNTSSFNCRRAVGSATGSWCSHPDCAPIDVTPLSKQH